MANNPSLLKMPLAVNGDKTTIPETTGSTTGDFSQEYGFQQINSLPLGAGGIAPKRTDFNGAFNLVSGILFYAQKGWIFEYDNTQDYYVGCIVKDPTDGNIYQCVADMTIANTVAPSADNGDSYWVRLPDLKSYIRRAGTHYTSGQFVYHHDLPVGWYLQCTTTGNTANADLSITSPTVGATKTDGTVIWTIRKPFSTADISDYRTKILTPAFNTRDEITTSGTYIAPVTGWYKITLKGGGGGGTSGGYNSTAAHGGPGGGEGGTTMLYKHMTAGTNVGVTIGAGGSGGSGGQDKAGSNGGTTTVTISSASYNATGGSGGTSAGSGGVGGGGDINGCPGVARVHVNTGSAPGGSGGGAGGGNGNYNAVGTAGEMGGGGSGGGAQYNNSYKAGGAGGNGDVWMEYWAN